jgi:hypothetical protein
VYGPADGGRRGGLRCGARVCRAGWASGGPNGWETAGVVFVADALGGWLVGQLADAGRKKLNELVLEVPRAFRTVHPIGWTIWKGEIIAPA